MAYGHLPIHKNSADLPDMKRSRGHRRRVGEACESLAARSLDLLPRRRESGRGCSSLEHRPGILRTPQKKDVRDLERQGQSYMFGRWPVRAPSYWLVVQFFHPLQDAPPRLVADVGVAS